MNPRTMRRAQRTRRPRRVAGSHGRQAAAQRTGSRTAHRTSRRASRCPRSPSKLGADYDTDWARTAGRPRRPGRHHRRPAAADGARRRLPRGHRARPARRPHADSTIRRRDLHTQPPQPPRHEPDDPVDPALLAPKLVVAAAADYFFDKQWKAALSALVAQRDPDRSRGHRPQVERHVPRPDRRRAQLADLSRRRALARRLGPGVQGRRRLPVGAHRDRRSCRCSSTAPARSSARA